MFNSDVLGANSDLLRQARIFPSAIRNPQNLQLNKFSGYDEDVSEGSGLINRIYHFDLFDKEEQSPGNLFYDIFKQWNTKKLPKRKETLPKRRPFNYRCPNQIIENNDRYTTNFENPDVKKENVS